jgi:predicted MFS family arabinose efflux permease
MALLDSPCAGGFLAQAFGWTAPFYALLAFAAGIILPATLLLVRETNQYIILKRLSPAEAATVKEALGILASPPKFGSLWAPLVIVCDRQVVLHLLQATVGFAAMLSAQTELPGVLSAPPYNMSPGLIGVAFIATGGAGMIASPLGGKLFDRAAATAAQPMIRLETNNLASLIGALGAPKLWFRERVYVLI